VALAAVDRLSFTYPFADRPALVDVSLQIGEGEVVALLGRSGSGKSSLLRALAGLVPHFHGGTFAGRVVVGGQDTRLTRPADLAGTVATVFQDPEDQVVFTRVAGEVAFGLENIGTPPGEIHDRSEAALAAVGALHLADRRVGEISGGELQRICLASALALRPRLLLLDEPTSQLDPAGADAFLDAVRRLGTTVVLSEHRAARALDVAGRVLFLDGGRLVLDAPRREAIAWLDAEAPTFSRPDTADLGPTGSGAPVASLAGIGFSYRPGVPVLAGANLEVRRGEVVVLEGPNGAGKTTLAKIAAGLLEPHRGSVTRTGRAGYLSQDPGRYVVCEHALDEVALAVHGNRDRARAALDRVGLGWAADRHPRDLSSGERERLGLAAVAVAEPDLLVLDEPTRGVDPDRRAELAAWLHTYARTGKGVLVATHERAFPAHRRVALGTVEARLAA
jgi:energy-coupling factor transport system ATP-binding protein